MASDLPNYPSHGREMAFWRSSRCLPALSRICGSFAPIRTRGRHRSSKPRLVKAPRCSRPTGGSWRMCPTNRVERRFTSDPFPVRARSVTISTDGGNEPVWSRTGRELFYRSGDAMMAVDITGPGFRRWETETAVRTALPNRASRSGRTTTWHPMSQRFLMVKRLTKMKRPLRST